MTGISKRATLRPKNWYDWEDGETVRAEVNRFRNLMSPTMGEFRGIIFPYTPSVIQTDFQASYGEQQIVHSAYQPHYFVQSPNPTIQVQAQFTCQDKREFIETACAIEFLKGATKPHFGIASGDKAGLPPPVLLFSAHGANNFKDIPVVVKSFSYVLDDQADYVEESGIVLPTKLMMSITLGVQYAPTDVRDNFSVGKYRLGQGGKFL